jgi:hypothetical protein
MEIDHCGRDIRVSEEVLHGADIDAAFQEVGGNARALAQLWEGKSMVPPRGNRSEAELWCGEGCGKWRVRRCLTCGRPL